MTPRPPHWVLTRVKSFVRFYPNRGVYIYPLLMYSVYALYVSTFPIETMIQDVSSLGHWLPRPPVPPGPSADLPLLGIYGVLALFIGSSVQRIILAPVKPRAQCSPCMIHPLYGSISESVLIIPVIVRQLVMGGLIDRPAQPTRLGLTAGGLGLGLAGVQVHCLVGTNI